MKLPNEMTVTIGESEVRVRFDYDRGEDQWFDARAGVGSPGYDPCVEVTEVCWTSGKWETPDVYPQVDWGAVADEILERLAELEREELAAWAEYEYDRAREDKLLGGMH